MPAILIAEDHSVVRLGTVILIREMYPDALIAEARTFDEALTLLGARSFDLLLLDIGLPGGDNLQMIEAVQLRRPDIPILIFSNYSELLYARRYMQAGAKGYLQKNATQEEIKSAIRRTLNKEKYISAALQQQLLDDILDPTREKKGDLDLLSNREMEVMKLMIKGMSPTDIKQALNIRYSTVSTYKERIFTKMGVTNIIDLVKKVSLLTNGTSRSL